MRVAILDDFQDCVRGLDCFARLAGHDVTVLHETLVDPDALAARLGAGRPGMAAVDVFESEPTLDHPLIHHPRVLATPHLGYVERESYELYLGTAFENVVAFARGESVNLADPGVRVRAAE